MRPCGSWPSSSISTPDRGSSSRTPRRPRSPRRSGLCADQGSRPALPSRLDARTARPSVRGRCADRASHHRTSGTCRSDRVDDHAGVTRSAAQERELVGTRIRSCGRTVWAITCSRMTARTRRNRLTGPLRPNLKAFQMPHSTTRCSYSGAPRSIRIVHTLTLARYGTPTSSAGTPHFSPRQVRVAASRRLLGMYCWKKSWAWMLSIQIDRNTIALSRDT